MRRDRFPERAKQQLGRSSSADLPEALGGRKTMLASGAVTVMERYVRSLSGRSGCDTRLSRMSANTLADRAAPGRPARLAGR